MPPHKPLCANSIGSLTKGALQKLGIDTTFWKPHSTRGAGVTMFKRLGMSSEEVCEVGKWKNVNAFNSHYVRLGASDVVGEKIGTMVHNVSPLSSADPDQTWTTGMQDLGGNVWEGDAQSNGEPTPPPLNEHVFGTQNYTEGGNDDNAQGVHNSHDVSGVPSLEGSSSSNFLPPSCFLDKASSSNQVSPLTSQKRGPFKRKRERGGSPPTKFVFASPKGKEIETRAEKEKED